VRGRQSLRTRAVRGGSTLIRLALGFLFLWSAVPKLQHSYDFLGNVYQYEIAGPTSGLWIAMVVPWLEFVAGVCLICNVLPAGAILSAIALGGLFLAAQWIALRQGLSIPCGCFGPVDAASSGDVLSRSTLLRAWLVLTAGLVGYLLLFLHPSGGCGTNEREANADRSVMS
jgi:uncharacterized membrane protein YphA (DoxX/SURF4 family)